MPRTHLSVGAQMAATSHYLRQSSLSDTLGQLADAVGGVVADKILIRRECGEILAVQLLAMKHVRVPISRSKVIGTSPTQAHAQLHVLVKGLVAQVLEDSLAAQTEQGKRLRMAIIGQLANHEQLVGNAALGEGATPGGKAKPADALLTTEQVASQLEVSRPYVAMLCDSGKLGEVEKTEGGHRRIRQSAVEAYRAERLRALADALSPREAAVQAGLYTRSDDEYVNVVRQVRKPGPAAKKSTARRASRSPKK